MSGLDDAEHALCVSESERPTLLTHSRFGHWKFMEGVIGQPLKGGQEPVDLHTPSAQSVCAAVHVGPVAVHVELVHDPSRHLDIMFPHEGVGGHLLVSPEDRHDPSWHIAAHGVVAVSCAQVWHCEYASLQEPSKQVMGLPVQSGLDADPVSELCVGS